MLFGARISSTIATMLVKVGWKCRFWEERESSRKRRTGLDRNG